MHSSTAYISASAELLAVIVCLFDTQCIGPDSHSINPDNDLLRGFVLKGHISNLISVANFFERF